MKSDIIQIIDIHKIYTQSEEVSVTALKDINLSVKSGEYIAIMGASGSGKSTFMNILGFLDTPTSGTYILDGIDGSSLSSNQKAEIRNRKMESLGSFLYTLSPKTAQALKEYEWVKDLFSWKDFLNNPD